MHSGYLPLIVRTSDKANYLTALRLADAGELSALIDYLFSLAEWSLNLGIKAAKGEAIEELSDVEKEIAIFVRNQQARIDGAADLTRSMIRELMASSLVPFVERVRVKLQKLTPLFRTASCSVLDGLGHGKELLTNVPLSENTLVGPGDKLVITFLFQGYQGEAPLPFDLTAHVGIHFLPGKYTITYRSRAISSHDYSTLVLADEAEQLSSQILAEAFQAIKQKSGIKE